MKIFCIEFSSPENYHWKETLGASKESGEKKLIHPSRSQMNPWLENKEFKAEVFRKHAMYQNIADSVWKEVVMLIRNSLLSTQRRYLQTQRCERKIMLLKERVQAMRRHLRKKFKRRGGGTCLVVQWLRLHTTTAVGTGSIPGWGTKIPHAVRQGQKKKKVELSQNIYCSEDQVIQKASFLQALECASESLTNISHYEGFSR